jgi:hypothetical protein
MSSVTRFLRQIAVPNQLVVPGALATLAAASYEFVPTTANYVGNYPPGAMVLGTTASSGIAGQIANALATPQAPAGAVAVLRDMGKTVYAPIVASEAAAQSLVPGTSGNYGFFREYQLLVVSPLVNSNFIGGPTGTTFGVAGTQAAGYTPYLTFYLPSAVAGIFAGTSAALLSQSVGGQL